jgi:hypothetical protein
MSWASYILGYLFTNSSGHPGKQDWSRTAQKYGREKNDCEQGDQIQRFFARWVIVYSGQFVLKVKERAHIFRLLFT